MSSQEAGIAPGRLGDPMMTLRSDPRANPAMVSGLTMLNGGAALPLAVTAAAPRPLLSSAVRERQVRGSLRDEAR